MSFPSPINGGTAPFDYYTKSETLGLLNSYAKTTDIATVQATSNLANQSASQAVSQVSTLTLSAATKTDLQTLTQE